MAEIVKKPKNTAVKVCIDGDNTGLMAVLNEIEETIDRIQKKSRSAESNTQRMSHFSRFIKLESFI